jgi:hypothetical protein
MTTFTATVYIDPVNGVDAAGNGAYGSPVRTLHYLFATFYDAADPTYYAIRSPAGALDVLHVRIRFLGGVALLGRPILVEERVLLQLQGVYDAMLMLTMADAAPIFDWPLLFCDSMVPTVNRGARVLQNMRLSSVSPEAQLSDYIIGNLILINSQLSAQLRSSFARMALRSSRASDIVTQIAADSAVGCISNEVVGTEVALTKIGLHLVNVHPDFWRNYGVGHSLPQEGATIGGLETNIDPSFDYIPLKKEEILPWESAVTTFHTYSTSALLEPLVLSVMTDPASYHIIDDLAPVYTVPERSRGWFVDLSPIPGETVVAPTYAGSSWTLAGDNVVGRLLGPVMGPYPASFRFSSVNLAATEDLSTPGSRAVLDATPQTPESKTIEVRGQAGWFDGLPSNPLPFVRIARGETFPFVGSQGNFYYQFRVTMRTNGL